MFSATQSTILWPTTQDSPQQSMLNNPFTFTGTLYLLPTMNSLFASTRYLPPYLIITLASFELHGEGMYFLLSFLFSPTLTLPVVIADRKCQLFEYSLVPETTCRERAATDRFSLSHARTHTQLWCNLYPSLSRKSFFSFNIHGGQRGLHPPTVFTSLWEENTQKNISSTFSKWSRFRCLFQAFSVLSGVLGRLSRWLLIKCILNFECDAVKLKLRWTKKNMCFFLKWPTSCNHSLIWGGYLRINIWRSLNLSVEVDSSCWHSLSGTTGQWMVWKCVFNKMKVQELM